MAPVHLLEQLIASRSGHTQIEIVRQTDLISDLHILQHVFGRKVGLKITANHFRQFHRKSCRMAGVTAHCLDELVQRQAQSLNKRQRFRSCLDACRRDHVGCDLDGARLANCRSDLDDLFTAGFEDRTRVAQCRIIPAYIINELSVFGCSFTPCKWRLNKARLATFDNLSGGAH